MKNRALALIALLSVSLCACGNNTKTEVKEEVVVLESNEQEDKLDNYQTIFTEVSSEVVEKDEIINVDSFVKLDESENFFKINLSKNITKVEFYECSMSKSNTNLELGKMISSPKISNNAIYIEAGNDTLHNIIFKIYSNFKDITYEMYYDSINNKLVFEEKHLSTDELTYNDIIELYANTTYYIDITADDKPDTIKYNNNFRLIDNSTRPVLTVNGVDYTEMFQSFDNAYDSFFITSLEQLSDYCELIFVNEGEKGPTFTIMKYNGIEMEVVAENIYGMPGKSIFVNEGKLVGVRRSDMLATVYVDASYSITQRMFIEALSDEIYEYDTYKDQYFTAIADMTIYTERDHVTGERILRSGTKCKSNKTDSRKWVNIILENGNEYWLDIENVDANELFDGLIFEE